MSGASLTLLGFDYGTQRIGIALGQTITSSVRPLTTLKCKNQKPDWESISALIREWQPEKLVVGLPLHMDGTEQPMSEKARRFGNQLKGRYNLPVEMVDERLTSNEAEIQLAEQGGRYEKEDIDALAAQLILESWLSEYTRNKTG